MKIVHVALWVEGLEKMRGFYESSFGCRSNEKYINKSKGFSSYFLDFGGGATIELMCKEGIDRSEKSDKTGYTHIALSPGDRRAVDRLTEKFESIGVKVVSAPRVTGDGYYESVIEDPEGNLIELVSED